jgi:hypothetical protein
MRSTCRSSGLISFDTATLSAGQQVSLWTPSLSRCDFLRAKSSESWAFSQENFTLHLLKEQLHGPVISTTPRFGVPWSAGMKIHSPAGGFPNSRARKGTTKQSRDQDRTVARLRCTFLVRLHSIMSRFIRLPTHRRDVEMKSAPHEDTTLQLLRAYLEALIEITQPRAHNVWAEFVFNLDESRTSELEDRMDGKYVISYHAKGKTIFHGIYGEVKHISSAVYTWAWANHVASFLVLV